MCVGEGVHACVRVCVCGFGVGEGEVYRPLGISAALDQSADEPNDQAHVGAHQRVWTPQRYQPRWGSETLTEGFSHFRAHVSAARRNVTL